MTCGRDFWLLFRIMVLELSLTLTVMNGLLEPLFVTETIMEFHTDNSIKVPNVNLNSLNISTKSYPLSSYASSEILKDMSSISLSVEWGENVRTNCWWIQSQCIEISTNNYVGERFDAFLSIPIISINFSQRKTVRVRRSFIPVPPCKRDQQQLLRPGTSHNIVVFTKH